MNRYIDPADYAALFNELGRVPQPGEMVCVMLRGAVWSGRVTQEIHEGILAMQRKLWGTPESARQGLTLH